MNHPPLPELDQLSSTERPPPELEDRVMARLHSRSLLGSHGPQGRRGAPFRWLVAACLMAAVGGWMARGWIDPPASNPTSPTLVETPRVPTGEYLLLLVEPRPLKTSKSLAVLVDEYRAWAGQVADQGRLVSAGRLHPGGPYLAEASDLSGEPAGIGAVTGFFVIRAGSLEEARELAATCPHRSYGGEISIRSLAGNSDPPAV